MCDCDLGHGHGLDLIDVAKQAAVNTTIWAAVWTSFREAKTHDSSRLNTRPHSHSDVNKVR
jgi:hypothetical protein